jgi:hypothetical protein
MTIFNFYNKRTKFVEKQSLDACKWLITYSHEVVFKYVKDCFMAKLNPR